MNGFDRVLSRIVLGTITPVMFFLTGWWGSYLLLGDSPVIGPCALVGLAAGIVLDIFVFRRKLDSLFALKTPALTAIALFYSIMMYGFFMGFPVFNLAVGITWAYVVGRRSVIDGAARPTLDREIRGVAAIATTILFALCVSTAVLALRESTIESELRGMLSLDFEVTRGMVYALIFGGGGALLVTQYVSVVLTARRFASGRADTGSRLPVDPA